MRIPFSQDFLLWCQDQNLINQGSWDENKTGILLLGERGSHIKMFDDTRKWMWCILFWKAFFLSCHMASVPTKHWWLVRKVLRETQSYDRLVKLQRLGSPPHRCYTVVFLWWWKCLVLRWWFILVFVTSFTCVFLIRFICSVGPPWIGVSLIGVYFSFYLCSALFLSSHLTVWQCLLIKIISLCSGVASLGIFSVYILIGQVDRNWGAGRR